MVITGVDKLENIYTTNLKGKNLVLISSSSNVNSSGQSVYKIVKKIAGKKLKSIWSLQHGFFVDKQDNMVFSKPFYWEEMDIKVRSLYGESLLPEENWIDEINTILIDIFDVGTRVYTFVNHIIKIMKFYSGKDIELIVLDRPNPLGGKVFEGNIAENEYFSIVGELPVPMRHGLTVGEYLNFAKNYFKIDIDLKIIKNGNWKRELYAQVWTYPSPNMPTFNTAIVYPGSVLLEGTEISEGRGTTRPFEFVGAPYIDEMALTDFMNNNRYEGVVFIPIFFKPEFSKFKGEICKGIYVNVQNHNKYKSFEVFYEIIRWVYKKYPKQFKWKKPPYEYEYKRPPIDMINGSQIIRKSIESDKRFSELEETINPDISKYQESIKAFLLY